MKKLMTFLLTLILLFGCCALPASASAGDGFANFQKTGEYSDGLFDDVAEGDWYRDYVAAAFELGLMRGDGNGSFNAAGNVKLSETIVLAARLHSLYTLGSMDFTQGDPWYQVYVDYALEKGLIAAAPEDLDAAATRRAFADILAHALPDAALPEQNSVPDNVIPDVKMTNENAAEIYHLYRAGILTGNNAKGTFTPEAPIQRSAVATIVSRMAYRSLRQKITLEFPNYPDLDEQPAVAEGFFSNSAMLGNSLAQGMQLYSGLDEMTFYAYQSITVKTAGSYVEQFCQHSYDKIYIEYGVNEIYMSPEDFTAAYGKIVDRIKEAMPDADVYVMAITPVTKARSDEGNFTMARVNALNDALYTMCAEKGCWYLDCCAPLEDSAGYLIADYAGWDGSPHLSVSGYKAWADVIRTHYA